MNLGEGSSNQAATRQPPGRPSDYAARRASTGLGLDRRLVQQLVEFIEPAPVRFELWDGSSLQSGRQPARVTLRLADRNALVALCVHPELYFGDLYSSGRLQVAGDLVALIESIYRSLQRLHDGPAWLRALRRLYDRRIHNTPAAARENIHRHYDLGNDFYALWLDRDHMQYTCAYYPDPALPLEAAQAAKLHHVCRKLQLRPGERVVEAGCGWGGLACFMAREYGVHVRAYNISTEQVRLARARAAAQGLQRQVEFVEDDYRNVDGRYDAFVSVGMLEHVGPSAYPELAAVLGRCLEPHGRGLLHSIGRSAPRPMNAWIERRIFPGAYPPSLGEMMAVLEPGRFAVRDVENLRQHYAQTLRHWLERFETQRESIAASFDDEFVRAWRLYLSGSIAAFSTGQLQLYQVLFAHPDNLAESWSRAWLYDGQGPGSGA
ncbi:MAG TPA: cyclopropane-fatty-acyl-phospholipid synthase family protein [Gammaproteobacteria bacterium]